MDLQVKEGIQTLLITLNGVQILMVVLFVRILDLDIRQMFLLDVLILLSSQDHWLLVLCQLLWHEVL